MACNCGSNRAGRRGVNMPATRSTSTASASAVTAATKVWYEVWRNGASTGRRSDSLVTAQEIARRLNGEVRTVTGA